MAQGYIEIYSRGIFFAIRIPLTKAMSNTRPHKKNMNLRKQKAIIFRKIKTEDLRYKYEPYVTLDFMHCREITYSTYTLAKVMYQNINRAGYLKCSEVQTLVGTFLRSMEKPYTFFFEDQGKQRRIFFARGNVKIKRASGFIKYENHS